MEIDYLASEKYSIILAYNTFYAEYSIAKKGGLKNKKIIYIEYFDELQTILQDNFVKSTDKRDFKTELNEHGTGEVYNKHYEYQITERTPQDRYLKRNYAKVLEDTYKGTIIYNLSGRNIITIKYIDNNNFEQETPITLKAAEAIQNKLLESNQEIIVIYARKSTKPYEATRISQEVEEIVEKQLEEFIDIEEFINIDKKEVIKENKVQRSNIIENWINVISDEDTDTENAEMEGRQKTDPHTPDEEIWEDEIRESTT
jgi:hypothetical protein